MELRLPLRWIAILKGRVDASLAATTGVHTGEDVLKLLLAGADVTMMASALLRHGPEWIRTVQEGVERVAGDARVRVGGADEGLDEPGISTRPGRLRAQQLHGEPDHLLGSHHLRAAAPGRTGGR